MGRLRAIALALCALLAIPVSAFAQSTPVNGPTTFAFTAASQSNVWTCNQGQSSFSLIVPAGLTGTFTVTVSQTSGGTYVNPPWSYTPGIATYTNTLTNSGALTVNLGSNGYVKVADTAYTSGSVTVTGSCSGAVAVVPPQIAAVNAGANIVVSAAPTPSVSTTMAPTFTGAITGNAAATPSPAPVGYNGPAVIAQATAAPTVQPGYINISGSITTGAAPLFGGVPSWVGAIPVAQGGTGATTLAGANIALTNATNTFTADQTINSNVTFKANGVGGSLDHAFSFYNYGSTITVPSQISLINSYLPNINTSCTTTPLVQQWAGASGANATSLGGYQVFATKSDGSCAIHEAYVLTPAQHQYPAGPTAASCSGTPSTATCSGSDNLGWVYVATTPATCSAGVPCGTVTLNFGSNFYQTNGTTTEPAYCFFKIQDTNLASNAWLAVDETPAANAYSQFVVGYAPLVAQSTPRTIYVYYRCYASSY